MSLRSWDVVAVIAMDMAPPPPQPHRQGVADRIRAWAIHEGASDLVVRQILGCLDESWLRSLPVRKKSRPWPAVPTSVNFRHHWRRQVAHFLRWEKRTDFGEEVNSLLRVELWPTEDHGDGAVADGNHGGSNSSDGAVDMGVAAPEIPNFAAKTEAGSCGTVDGMAACGDETGRASKRLCRGDQRSEQGTPAGGIAGSGGQRVGNADCMQPTPSGTSDGCSRGLRILPAWFGPESKTPREWGQPRQF